MISVPIVFCAMHHFFVVTVDNLQMLIHITARRSRKKNPYFFIDISSNLDHRLDFSSLKYYNKWCRKKNLQGLTILVYSCSIEFKLINLSFWKGKLCQRKATFSVFTNFNLYCLDMDRN